MRDAWWINKDFYDKKQQEYRAKQDIINKNLDGLQHADEECYITASYILNLANRAYDLFLSSEPDIKRKQKTMKEKSNKKNEMR